MRVLKWIVDRCQGGAQGVDTPIGRVPAYEQLEWSGLERFSREQFATVTAIRPDEWRAELASHDELFGTMRDRLPNALAARREAIGKAMR
jgi:phosphoenolpyruvate carboxykinase (GTP)